MIQQCSAAPQGSLALLAAERCVAGLRAPGSGAWRRARDASGGLRARGGTVGRLPGQEWLPESIGIRGAAFVLLTEVFDLTTPTGRGVVADGEPVVRTPGAAGSMVKGHRDEVHVPAPGSSGRS